MTTYLTQTRRTLEIIMSAFGVLYGLGLVMLISASPSNSPLYWIEWSREAQADAGLLILSASLIHAIGINLNGGWRWSPGLRALGSVIHASMATAISVAVYTTPSHYGPPSGILIYPQLAFMFWVLAIGAIKDLQRSLAIWRACHG